MRQSFLTESFKSLCKRFPGTKEVGVLADPRGKYAIQFARPDGRHYFFCAKAKTSGTVVSIHESLLMNALMYGRGIVMGIVQDFYQFDPHEIRRLTLFTNEYHGAIMVNFNMEIGKPLTPPPPPFDEKKLSRKARTVHRALVKEFDVVPV